VSAVVVRHAAPQPACLHHLLAEISFPSYLQPKIKSACRHTHTQYKRTALFPFAQVSTPAASRSPDPRALRDGFGHLPCHLAALSAHHDLAHLLHPRLPLSSALGGASSLYSNGAPSLKLLAAAALRGRQRKTLAAAQAALGLASGGGGDAPNGTAAAVACCKVGVGAAAAGGHRVRAACAVDVAACEAASPDAGAGAPLLGKDVSFVLGPTPARSRAAAAPGSSGEAVLGPPQREAAPTDRGGCSNERDGEDSCCGVCLDAPPGIRLKPCGHAMCSACCSGLFSMQHAEVVACPFCRSVIGCFSPACC
jgi:hypothetical protein